MASPAITLDTRYNVSVLSYTATVWTIKRNSRKHNRPTKTQRVAQPSDVTRRPKSSVHCVGCTPCRSRPHVRRQNAHGNGTRPGKRDQLKQPWRREAIAAPGAAISFVISCLLRDRGQQRGRMSNDVFTHPWCTHAAPREFGCFKSYPDFMDSLELGAPRSHDSSSRRYGGPFFRVVAVANERNGAHSSSSPHSFSETFDFCTELFLKSFRNKMRPSTEISTQTPGNCRFWSVIR